MNTQQELDNALLAILGDLKAGDIAFAQALEEIKQVMRYHTADTEPNKVPK